MNVFFTPKNIADAADQGATALQSDGHVHRGLIGYSTFLAALVVAIGCGSVSSPGPTGAPGAAFLTLAKPSRWVPQNGATPLAFTITRGSMVTGGLTVHVTGLPAGVTAPDVDVASGETAGTVTFAGSTQAALGSSTSVNVTLSDATMTYDTKPFIVKVSGAPGTLDTTFGTNGQRTLPLPDPVIAATSGNAAARYVVQYPATAGANAGKIVIAADLVTSGASSTNKRIAIARFNPDGTVDTSFGGGMGYVLLYYGGSDALRPVSTALDSQGRIVLAAALAQTVCNFVIDRINADGSTDSTLTTFNSEPPGGYCGSPAAMAVVNGDKIVAAGTWNNPDQSQRPLHRSQGGR